MNVFSYIKNCFGMFTFSKEAFDEINQKATFKIAFLTFFFIYFFILFLDSLILSMSSSALLLNLLLVYFGLGLVMVSIFFIFTLVVHIFFKIADAKGSYIDTIRGFFSTSIVFMILLFLFAFLLTIISTESEFFDLLLQILFIGLIILIFFYSIIVEIKLFTQIHEISTFKSTLSVIFGYLLIFVVLLVISFIIISMFGVGLDGFEFLAVEF